MKQALKALLRPVWRAAAPLRRILVRKLEGHVARLLVPVFQQIQLCAETTRQCHAECLRGFDRLAQSVSEYRPVLDGVTRELDGVTRELDGVTRELARLHAQVELLQQTVPLAEAPPEDLSWPAGELEGQPHEDRPLRLSQSA
jgi:hypothetical protein